MLKKNTTRGLLLTTCAAATLVSTGCRSMPGMGIFARHREPSAEVIAGNGPTTTYPAPPSASATPEAIASVAGGTAPSKAAAALPGSRPDTAQVAGVGVTPGYATPATNMGAAQANGVYAKSASFNSQTASNTKSSGYTFGSKSLPPIASTTSASAKPSTYPLPTAGAATNSYAAAGTAGSGYSLGGGKLAAAETSASATVATPKSSSTTSSGGYTLPASISPATAAITPPSPTTSPSPEEGSYSLPESTSPAFSTASTADSVTAASGTNYQPSSTNGSGYTPGSTGVARGYPTGNDAPTTSGSFYR